MTPPETGGGAFPLAGARARGGAFPLAGALPLFIYLN